MKVISAHSPRWSSSDHVNIDIWVTLEGIGEVPFTASPDDSEEHGREIHARAMAGEFGAIADHPKQA